MLFAAPGAMLKKNQSELRIRLLPQSNIQFVSAEQYQNLRGETLHGVVIDEARDLKKDIWEMMLRPMLARTKGWAAFLSTTNGFDWFYDLAQKALKQKEWSFTQAPSTIAPWWDDNEVNSAKSSMSGPIYRQEILAEFVDLTSGRKYSGFSVANESEKNPFCLRGEVANPVMPVYVGPDFNVAHMSWTLLQSDGYKFHAFDQVYIEQTIEGTKEAAEECARKILELNIRADPQVILIGDASGNSRKTSSVGKTDYSIIEAVFHKYGIKFENQTPEANPHIKDRVNSVNSVLKSVHGVVCFTLNPIKCDRLRTDFQREKWPVPGSPNDKSLGHAADGCGYIVHVVRPMEGVLQDLEMRVLKNGVWQFDEDDE